MHIGGERSKDDMVSSTGEKKHIVIIGGGIIGCSSAYFMTRHAKFDRSRHKVTILESTKIAGGASGKAGGLLALWAYPKALVDLSYKTHGELAKEHGGAQRWGYRAVSCGEIDCTGQLSRPNGARERSGKPGIKGGPSDMNGTAEDGDEGHVSLQKRSAEVLAKLQSAGVPDDLDWVDAGSVSSYEAMGDPSNTAQVHPFLFTTAMAELAQKGGAEVVLGAHVKEILFTPDGKAVRGVSYEDCAAGGTHSLDDVTDVIVAAGPWSGLVYPPAPISALRAHSVTIRTKRPVSAYALFTQIKLPTAQPGGRKSSRPVDRIVTPEIYARPDGEVYACGEGDRLVPLPRTTADVVVDQARCADVIEHVSAISEELARGEVTARQACYLPNVDRGAGHPLVGPTAIAGLFLCTGHTCWGIQNGPGSGKLMSEFVFDGKAVSANVRNLDPRSVIR